MHQQQDYQQLHQQASNALQQARQTLSQASSNPSPELFRKAQQEVNQGRKLINDLHAESGLSIQFQAIEQDLNNVQESISQAQQALYNRLW
ncbi:MAG: hypothetical protein ACOX47_01035 [Bacillota bacterium]|jgi:hypothetical protein